MGRRGAGVTAGLLLSASLALSVAPPVVAAPGPSGDGTEVAQRPAMADPGVRVGLVTLDAPLPPSDGPRPARCDELRYLRYRAPDGPSDPQGADAVVVLMPGLYAGAGSLDTISRALVRRADEDGRHIEVWALDRRANCVEDPTGMDAARRSGRIEPAVDYYLRGAEIDGRRFAGYRAAVNTPVLGRLGLHRVVMDEWEVIRRGLPDPAFRAKKLVCGGHSLGGILTGAFASWDLGGGTPGYAQCAGFVALDTEITMRSPKLQAYFGGAKKAMADAAINRWRSTGFLTPNYPLLVSPDSFSFMELAGAAAAFDPGGEDTALRAAPLTKNLKVSHALLHDGTAAESFADLAAGTTALQRMRLTNRALLGSLLDDQAFVLGPLRGSLGFFDGPVVKRSFPIDDGVARSLKRAIPVWLGNFADVRRTAVPVERGVPGTTAAAGPVVDWRGYDDLGSVPLGPDGQPWTAPGRESVDIDEAAAMSGSYPVGMWEPYFSMRTFAEFFGVQMGGTLKAPGFNAYPDGPRRRWQKVELMEFGPFVPHGGMLDVGVPDDVTPWGAHLDVVGGADPGLGGLPNAVYARVGAFIERVTAQRE